MTKPRRRNLNHYILCDKKAKDLYRHSLQPKFPSSFSRYMVVYQVSISSQFKNKTIMQVTMDCMRREKPQILFLLQNPNPIINEYLSRIRFLRVNMVEGTCAWNWYFFNSMYYNNSFVLHYNKSHYDKKHFSSDSG